MGKSILDSVSVVGYGVLGTQSQNHRIVTKANAPDEKTVFTDPAGIPFIQDMGPSRAGAASGAIYTHLGIDRDREFPADVRAAIREETQAHYRAYAHNDGKHHVIHVVGPMLGRLQREEACELLTAAYRNVLQQFVVASAENSALTSLRLLPISGGIFAGNWKREMPKLTMESLIEAAKSLTEKEQQTLKASKLELCIFEAGDLKDFEDAQRAALKDEQSEPLSHSAHGQQHGRDQAQPLMAQHDHGHGRDGARHDHHRNHGQQRHGRGHSQRHGRSHKDSEAQENHFKRLGHQQHWSR